jgi:predicted flap endonuclease-1-like 5' DNA nuclease
MADKSSLEKWVHGKAPGGNVQVESSNPEAAAIKGGPLPVSDTPTNETEGDERVRATQDTTQEVGVITAEGTVVKGGTIEGEEVVGGVEKPVPDNFAAMEGVGEALEQSLYEAGYSTFEDIAKANKADMSEKTKGINEELADSIIKQGKKLSKLKAKGKL